MPRQPLVPGQKCVKQMLVMTQTEKQKLKERAKREVRSMSELVRYFMEFEETYKPIVERVREILREING